MPGGGAFTPHRGVFTPWGGYLCPIWVIYALEGGIYALGGAFITQRGAFTPWGVYLRPGGGHLLPIFGGENGVLRRGGEEEIGRQGVMEASQKP